MNVVSSFIKIITSLLLAYSLAYAQDQTIQCLPKDVDPLLVIILMVKNEAPVICQTLQPYVDAGLDTFFIFDTGSTDDTVAVTKKFFDEHHIVRGVIGQEPFIDFATSRNRALQLAQESFPRACFMLMPDAEWYMHNVEELVQFCTLHKTETEASYLVRIMNNQIDFYTPRLIRCRTRTFFVGAVHEVLNRISRQKVSSDCFFEWRVSRCGQEKSRLRWTRDCQLLLKEYTLDKNNLRTVFYLAQTYSCLGDWENARVWYEKRIAMPGWDEENFFAHYKLAQAYEHLGDWDKAVIMYFKAFTLKPNRAEPLIRLAQYYWAIGNKTLCFLCAKYAAELPYPTEDSLFIEKELYDYTRYDLLGMSAWYVEQFNLGKEALLKALDAHPDEVHVRKNLDLYIRHCNSF
ncbi:MAG: glycosyltransferase family 2 protein [Candidatus Babeliales bacterium]